MRRTTAGTPRAPRRSPRTILRLVQLEQRETPAAGGFSSLDAAFGAAPIATVLRPDGTILARVAAYDPAFTGGVSTSVNEIDGNPNTIELVTGAGPGGGPHVKVFAVNTLTGAANQIAEFMAYEQSFRGGVNVASGNLSGDPNRAEVVTGPGVGGGPVVRAFTIGNGTGVPVTRRVGTIVAFDPAFRGGVDVAAGNFDGNTANGDELAVAAGPGGGPHVRVFNGEGVVVGNALAFDESFTGGVRLDTASATGQLFATAGSGAVGTVQLGLANGALATSVVTPFQAVPPALTAFNTPGGALALAAGASPFDFGSLAGFTANPNNVLTNVPGQGVAGNPFGLGNLSGNLTPAAQATAANLFGFNPFAPPAGSVTPLSNGAPVPGVVSPFGLATAFPGQTTAPTFGLGTIPGTTFNSANNTVPGFASGGFLNSNGILTTNGTTFGPSTFFGSPTFPAGTLTPGIASSGLLGPSFGSLAGGGRFTTNNSGQTVFAFTPTAFTAPSPPSPPVVPTVPTVVGPFGPIIP